MPSWARSKRPSRTDTQAIKLYPDFANAYIYRGQLRELLRDPKGARSDRETAQRKIAEYRSRLSDSTYSIFADTTQRFDRLLSFDSKLAGTGFESISGHNGGHEEMRLLPLFKFTLMRPDSMPEPYRLQRIEDFKRRIGNEYLTLSCRESNIAPDTLVMLDKEYVQRLKSGETNWALLFQTRRLAVAHQTVHQLGQHLLDGHRAEPLEPVPLSEPFDDPRRNDRLHLLDRQLLSADIDRLGSGQPLNNNSKRTYSYDEAVADLNKAIKLFPAFAEAYYNRANLRALSGSLPEAYEDYSKAIELNPAFAEAYYNRGVIQIFMKDTRKGCLDLSKAGELGITEAYDILKRYAQLED